MKQEKRSICVTISRREKDGAQPIISYMYLMVHLIMVDTSFTENTDVFVFFPAKHKCQILLQGICDATNIAVYYVVTIGKPEKRSPLIQFHVLPCNLNGFRPFKTV